MIVFFSSAATGGDLFSGSTNRYEKIKSQVGVSKPPLKVFNPSKDMIALHYDHAPDKDDGHSAAANRTILESIFGKDWIGIHVLPVSGAYGKNAGEFNAKSDAVMNAAWNDCGGWLSAHANRTLVITEMTSHWRSVLKAGGDIWVKEGGQSDVTAEVVRANQETDARGRHSNNGSMWYNTVIGTRNIRLKQHLNTLKITSTTSGFVMRMLTLI